MYKKVGLAIVLALFILSNVPLITVSQAPTVSYSPMKQLKGVLEEDREAYMNADGNPLHEDIANAVFQGPGIFGSPTVGYMKNLELVLTRLGTIGNMTYREWRWENTPQMSSKPGFPSTLEDVLNGYPLEGWVVYYKARIIDPSSESLDNPSGVVVATYSALGSTSIDKGKVLQSDYFYIVDSGITSEVWVDNPRLYVVKYVIPLRAEINHDKEGTPINETIYADFQLTIIIVFNKVTKFVEIFQKLDATLVAMPHDWKIELKFGMAREAILDANPNSDKAFYGWKTLKLTDPEEVFLVLSWVNKTLDPYIQPPGSYYAAYALAYPVPESFAISSTIYNYDDTSAIWSHNPIDSDTYKDYVALNLTTGDQALIRFDWKGSLTMIVNPSPTSETSSTGWKMIMYGIYDVTPTYDGGVGGMFERGELMINPDEYYIGNITNLVKMPDNVTITEWLHTGTLGYLNGLVNETTLMSHEGTLTKYVSYLDIDQDGNKDEAEDLDGDKVSSSDEYDIAYSWYPTEEFIWQLSWKFRPPVFCKEIETVCCRYSGNEFVGNDFLVMPSPGATPDAAGSAWLNGLFEAWLVTFDVEAYNMEATVGYTNPANKMLPYMMLRLEPIPSTTEVYRSSTWKSGRVGHYMTDDLRVLPQMEWTDVTWTQWRDVHYFAISVAGIHPNLLTFYANDFVPIVRPIGGDYGPGYLVVLPVTGPVSISEYVGGDVGAGVIALARDHFNNTYLIVYGLDAQDTYWTAWFATFQLLNLDEEYLCSQAIMIEIDYSNIGHEWGDGTGIPIAHPNYPFVNGEPGFTILYKAIEHGNLDGDWSCGCGIRM